MRRVNTAAVGGVSPAVTGPTWTDNFSLEDPSPADDNPNPDGELIDTTNEEDPLFPVSITLLYDAIVGSPSGTADVLVNGTKLGSLDLTTTSTTLEIPTSVLQDNNSLEIDDNSGLNVNLLEDLWDSGALPPEELADVPEPASVLMLAVGAGMLARRRKS